MPRYYRRRQPAIGPLSECLITSFGLLMLLFIFIWLFGIMSQPGALTFRIGPAPTTTPSPIAPPSVLAVPGTGLIAILGGLAILIGGSGLVILCAIWLFGRQQEKSRIAAARSSQMPAVNSREFEKTNAPSGIQGATVVPAEPFVLPAPPTAQPQMEEEGSEVEAQKIMTPPEIAFFWTLVKDLADDYLIFPQIPLRVLAAHKQTVFPPNESNSMLDWGSVDFLLVNPTSLMATVAIELDDLSHLQAHTRSRDRKKDTLLHKFGLEPLRVLRSEKWTPEDVRRRIKEATRSNSSVTVFSETESEIFRALRSAVPRFYLFPKVPLNKLLRRKNWLPLQSYVTLKNDVVDFVLVHPKYLGTLLVVEMDDLNSSSRGELLKMAGIPWICIDKADVAAPSQLHQKIARAIKE